MAGLTVLDCRAADDASVARGRAAATWAAFRAALERTAPGGELHRVGPRPGKAVDVLLRDRVLVVGDDADLAAVALRLLRRNLLGSVSVGVLTLGATPVTQLWSIPHGRAGAEALLAAATTEPARAVPLVRDDVGGVLVGSAELAPVVGTVYVDEQRVLRGPAARIVVRPDTARGLAVTVVPPRTLGMGRRARATEGRAVQIATEPVTVVRDGVPYPRPMDRWTFYKHTEPLLLLGSLPNA